MERYLKIHSYTRNKKARIVIFNLNGQNLIWWEHCIVVKKIRERKLDMEQFQRFF